MRFSARIFAALLGILLSAEADADAPPAVVASIKPVHALVWGVVRDIDEPHLLLKGAGSPHSHTMKPTDARKLEEAQIVFWIGEGLETFLERPIEVLAADARVVELGRAHGLTLLPLRDGGPWEGHAHVTKTHEDEHGQDEHDEHGHDEHGPGVFNMHIWLDPINAVVIVNTIAAELSAADPERADAYRANAMAMTKQLQALDAELRADLAPVKEKPYIVFHDAYPYFESRYGLSPAGSITVTPDQPPGAARLSEIRRTVRESGAKCVFSESQFPPRLSETVIEGTKARLGVLDPLGAAIPPGPGLYDTLMRDLAAALTACLLHEDF